MKNSEENRRTNFFKVIVFIVDIVIDVFRKYVHHQLPPEQDIYDFLVVNKHAVYHKWLYNIQCCNTTCDFHTNPSRKPDISLMHLETMYNINEPEKAGHEKRDKGKVLQHCLCKVSVKSGINIGALDLTTCYRLLRGFFILTPEQKLNLKYVIEQRNVINKYLNEKTMEGELFSKVWDQLEIPTLIIAAEIDSSFADEIFNRIKLLKRTKPSMKNSIQCYETYLEWFSRDDILRQEIRHAKLQRRLLSPSLPSIPEDQNRKMLVIIEVIMINLLKNLDGVQTDVERLPPDGMEAHDEEEPKKHCNNDNKIILKDPVISGVNAPTQEKRVTIETTEVPVVPETDSSKSNIQNEVIDNDPNIQGDNEKAGLANMETQTEQEDALNPENINQIEESNDKTDAVYHNVEIVLSIPGKTKWQIEAQVNELQNSVDEMSTESIKIHSLSVQSNVMSIQARLSHTVFKDRITLRDGTSEVLHKMFHMCRIADSFSVDVTFKIEGVDGIDPSKFIIKELSEKGITKGDENLQDRNTTFSTEPSMSPLTVTPDILNECMQCKEKDREIFTLQKKVFSLQAGKSALPPLRCKDCIKKDKQIFLMEQVQLKITNENGQKDRLIHSLHTDIATKESTIKSYVRLDRTNAVLDDQINTKEDLKKTKITHLYRKYSSSLFYTRPTSEPPEVLTRLPALPKASGQSLRLERPISEQVLKKPVNPSISYTNKKYLSAIRRYKDFIPTKKMSVLRYSYSDAKWKGQPKAPLFPLINLVINRDKQLLRPFSVRGKHVDLENASMAKDSGNRKIKVLDLSLPRM